MLAGLMRTIRALAGVTNVLGCHLTKVLRRHLTKVLRHLTRGCHLTKVLRRHLTNVASDIKESIGSISEALASVGYATRGASSRAHAAQGQATSLGVPRFCLFRSPQLASGRRENALAFLQTAFCGSKRGPARSKR